MTDNQRSSRSQATGKPRRLGIIYNTHSGRHRKRWGKHPLPAHIPAFEANQPEELRQAIAELARLDIDTLCIAGGDGTIQCILTCLLLEGYFQTLPTLALIPTGSTNMTAKDVGFLDIRRHGWQPLLDWAAGHKPTMGRITNRAILKVQPSDNQAAVCGMFFGTGAVHHAVQYTQKRLHGVGLRGEVGPTLTFLRFLKSIITGNNQQFSPIQMHVQDDKAHETQGPTLIFLASTLERLVLNFRPFWGREAAPLAWTAVSQHASHFLLRLPFIASGRSSALKTGQARGYISHNSNSLALDFDGGFIVDGEFYHSQPDDGPVRLSIAGYISFLDI